MAIGAEEKSLIQRIKDSPILAALRADESSKKRSERGALVKELATLRTEGIRGGPVPALEAAEVKAKAELEGARERLRKAEQGCTATSRALRDALDGRGNRVARLEDALMQSAPDEVRGFLTLSQRILEDVRHNRIPLRAPGFQSVREFLAALREARKQIHAAVYEDHDHDELVARVEAEGARFRFDLHKVRADVPDPIVF